jgi:hypothetical protein
MAALSLAQVDSSKHHHHSHESAHKHRHEQQKHMGLKGLSMLKDDLTDAFNAGFEDIATSQNDSKKDSTLDKKAEIVQQNLDGLNQFE